jgi:hypothetical protein
MGFVRSRRPRGTGEPEGHRNAGILRHRDGVRFAEEASFRASDGGGHISDIVSQRGRLCGSMIQAESSYWSTFSLGVRMSRCDCARARPGRLGRAVLARTGVTAWRASIGGRERSHERGEEARLVRGRADAR